MPKRLIQPAAWVIHHVEEHPGRLVVTAVAILLASGVLLVLSVWVSVSAGQSANVKVCRAVNELSRRIYVTLADFDVPLQERLKFLPTQNCDAL